MSTDARQKEFSESEQDRASQISSLSSTSNIGEVQNKQKETLPQQSIDSSSSSTHSSSNDVAEAPRVLTTGDIESHPNLINNVDDDDYSEAGLERVESSTNVSREISRALTNQGTPAEIDATYKTPLPPMGLNKKFPTEWPDREPYTVSYDGPDDPAHPHNWPLLKKFNLCAIIGYNTATIAWGSSIYSAALIEVGAEFHVSTTVATLGVSLYVLGFACGPVIWAPLSELYGRRIILLLSCFGFTIFSFACATGKDLQTIMLARAFSGVIGAAPLAVVPAAFADLFDNKSRGKAITIFSMTVLVMPIIAPVAGAFIVHSYLSWRWTEYITGIMSSLALVLLVFFFEETHHPVILVYKAREIKKRTGNWLIHAPHDEFELSVKDIVEKNITRPLKMLVQEPIILLITIYNSFIYGILYMLLSAYPIIFAEGYQMHGGVAELPYLAVAIGMFLGGCWCYVCEGWYLKDLAAHDGKIDPEARLTPMFAGSIAFPVGLFWFTWTGNYHNEVHWMAPTAAGIFIGFGLIAIFNPSLNYIIDSYLIFAASALAGNAFLRAACACAFPLFSPQMFHNMGVNWAGLLLALVGFILVPVPFLFKRFGKRIRTKSKYAFATT